MKARRPIEREVNSSNHLHKHPDSRRHWLPRGIEGRCLDCKSRSGVRDHPLLQDVQNFTCSPVHRNLALPQHPRVSIRNILISHGICNLCKKLAVALHVPSTVTRILAISQIFMAPSYGVLGGNDRYRLVHNSRLFILIWYSVPVRYTVPLQYDTTIRRTVIGTVPYR